METGSSRPLILGLLLMPAICLPALAQRQPHTLFKEAVGLSDSEIKKIESGNVFTKRLDSEDKLGLLVFGAIYVNAPVEKFADIYRNVEKLEKEEVYLAVEEFGMVEGHPTIADFKRMEFDEDDIDDLIKCKPGDCDLQIMNADNPKKLKAIAKANPSNKYALVNQALREIGVTALTHYRAGGLRTLGSYLDRKKPLNLYQATKDMVDASYYLPKDKAPDLYAHVVEYPNDGMKDAEDIFYWEKIDFGQGPVIRINHVSLFLRGAGNEVKFVAANKQLYASKYMRVGLQMFYCIPDSANPNKPGFYLIEMSDSRLPDFGRFKLAIVKKIASSTAIQGTRDTLEIFKRQMEGR